LAEALLSLDPTYDFVGIDISAEMIEIARTRVSEEAEMIVCDIAEMQLGRKFDAAISNGGTWVIIRDGDQMQMGVHQFDPVKDLRGIKNLAEHLDPGGILILSVHPPHANRDLELADGIVYSQRIIKTDPTSSHHSIKKNYSFRKGDSILAEEEMTLSFYEKDIFMELFSKANLEPRGYSETGEFFIFEKRADS